MRHQTAFFLFAFMIMVNPAFAKISALFHPYDPSLQEIATWFAKAQSRIDIAMYNMETTQKSPIIEYLSSPSMQSKIRSKEIKIRVIFEGYGTAKENESKMAELELLGLDVRQLKSTKKVHHKFAVIDGDGSNPLLVMGSANWSLSSQKNYNENILFAEDEPTLTRSYQAQFEHLWSYAKEFGNALELGSTEILFVGEAASEDLALPVFNTDNFIFSEQGIRIDAKAEGFRITRQIVQAINQAETHIEIATTRFKLRPIYEALVEAAKRGIKIRLILSQDDYEPYWTSQETVLKECADIFEEKCSSGTSFGRFLVDLNLPQVEVRFKYYNLDYREYILKQMHSKYLIVDGKKLLTGSFNWSVSSENSHIESLVVISGNSYLGLIEQYTKDFARLWNLGRNRYERVLRDTATVAPGTQVRCRLSPMVLSYKQIDELVRSFQGKTCEN